MWTDRTEDGANIAAAALIPHVVSRPEEVLGEVDAVIIATDDGDDHVRRVAPFVESGLPIFVDKPLATNLADLRQLITWREQGAKIISSSGLRYSSEMAALRGKKFRWITGTACKSWARYGIHALEPIYTIVGPGFATVRAQRKRVNLSYGRKASKRHSNFHRGHGGGLRQRVCFPWLRRRGTCHGGGEDNYTAFRAQLLSFLEYAAGKEPEAHPFAETVELMTILIAAEQSASRGGVDIDPAKLLR